LSFGEGRASVSLCFRPSLSRLRAPESAGGFVRPGPPLRTGSNERRGGPAHRAGRIRRMHCPKAHGATQADTIMNQNPGIIGTKVGMTQIFDEKGEVLRCTV